MLGSSTFKYLIAFSSWCVAAIAEWVRSRACKSEVSGSNPIVAVFSLKKYNFLKIEDKLSSKNLSPEIAVNQVLQNSPSFRKSWMTGKINLELANR